MNWIESLYRTYENCVENIADERDRIPLIPLAHIIQQTHIEISLDENGKLLGARVDPFITIIPCTEASAGRTNSPEAHPLSDKLKYVASDFFELTGESKPKPAKNGNLKDHHGEYLKLLRDWAGFPQGHPKLAAILKFLESNNGRVLENLCQRGIYPLEGGKIPKKWTGSKDTVPHIYETTKTYPSPWDVFVRWRVSIPGDPEDRTFFDKNLWSSWLSYYLSTSARNGLCYVTGKKVRLAAQHPKRIRSIADSAKLISSNDGSGFTFRGRFTDPDAFQACGVGFDVTQKAHSSLRWLISRQGRVDGDQAIVAWAVSGNDVPPLIASSESLLDDEEDYLTDESDDETEGKSHAEVGQHFALRLKSKIGGYRTQLGSAEKIVVLALDSATPGRMSITYYRELASSEFLDRIEKWHYECAWAQNFGKDHKFVGAPAPKQIAECAYGRRLDDKLRAATHRRLLPCIIEDISIPRDIVEACVRRASARHAFEQPWEWERSLGVTCALYRKQQINLNQHKHTMALERDRNTRSYLYGRLLAVADLLEQAALRSANENRDTNAARFMQRFADHPYSTWRTIYLSLEPYRRRLQANAPGLLAIYNKELNEIKEHFTTDQFENDSKLEGEFLLAFHCQRTALWTKQPEKEAPYNTNTINESL